MISIKHIVASLALGTALLVAPAAASAKTLHKTTKLHTVKGHAKPMHRTPVKHTALHTTHVKSKALSHKSKTKATAASTTGWKHHRGI